MKNRQNYRPSICSPFTGKERDRETGYGYFGARYMDHELLTSFISVDRYASKYPFLSPYAYCAWNPIKLMDPTGDTIIFNDKKVEKMFDDVYNDLSCRMFKLKNRGFKKESRREEYEALSKIKQSMDDVRNSKTKFYYSSLPNPDGSIKSGGHTYGKKGVDGIIVEITTGCFGTLVHETKHASQYISGDWELSWTKKVDSGRESTGIKTKQKMYYGLGTDMYFKKGASIMT